MAYRAGARIINAQYVQFHPTAFYKRGAPVFLISEAVRGAGAKLLNSRGEPFMPRYAPEWKDLAPRDVVARSIHREMLATKAECVFLDLHSALPTERILGHFPTIYKTCLEYGVDITRDLIPVVPAAHYFCGGVEAGVDGRTALQGLFACGEVACTGLHGANRLASNSLLEAVVCAREMAGLMEGLPPPAACPRPRIPDWECGAAVHSDEAIVVEHNWNEVRTCMWDYVGIVRTDKRLDRAARRISNLSQEIRQYYLDYLVTADILELRNIAAVGDLVIRSALSRKESRGLHYTLDHPGPLPGAARDTVLCGGTGGRG
jgi:L-aspartate oxidase